MSGSAHLSVAEALLPEGGEAAADWRYPLCAFGIPPSGLAGMRKLRELHRQRAHSDTLRQSCKLKCQSSFARTAACKMQRRIISLTVFAAHRKKSGRDIDSRGFRAFSWLFRVGNAGSVASVTELSCVRPRPLIDAKDLGKGSGRRCEPEDPAVIKRRVARLRKDEKEAKRMCHGVEATLLRRTFKAAREVWNNNINRACVAKSSRPLRLLSNFPCDVLALQEVDIDHLSSPSFTDTCAILACKFCLVSSMASCTGPSFPV